jgi:hypothetical protein
MNPKIFALPNDRGLGGTNFLLPVEFYARKMDFMSKKYLRITALRANANVAPQMQAFEPSLPASNVEEAIVQSRTYTDSTPPASLGAGEEEGIFGGGGVGGYTTHLKLTSVAAGGGGSFSRRHGPTVSQTTPRLDDYLAFPSSSSNTTRKTKTKKYAYNSTSEGGGGVEGRGGGGRGGGGRWIVEDEAVRLHANAMHARSAVQRLLCKSQTPSAVRIL